METCKCSILACYTRIKHQWQGASQSLKKKDNGERANLIGCASSCSWWHVLHQLATQGDDLLGQRPTQRGREGSEGGQWGERLVRLVQKSLSRLHTDPDHGQAWRCTVHHGRRRLCRREREEGSHNGKVVLHQDRRGITQDRLWPADQLRPGANGGVSFYSLLQKGDQRTPTSQSDLCSSEIFGPNHLDQPQRCVGTFITNIDLTDGSKPWSKRPYKILGHQGSKVAEERGAWSCPPWA